MKNKKVKNNNILYLKVFFLIFFVTLFISIILKTVFLVRTSKLAQQNFSVLVVGKDSAIYRINTYSVKIGIITIKNAPSEKLKTNLLSSILLYTPIDAIIRDEKNKQKEKYFSPANIFSILSGKREAKLTGMNSFDLLKVGYLFQRISNDNITMLNINHKDIAKNKSMPQNFFEILKDESIINRKISVEVVNATDIDGLGARVASVLTSVGYNVISIKSSDTYKKSEITYSLIPKEYASSLSRTFGIPYKIDNLQSLTDIKIVLSKDESTKVLRQVLSE